MGNVTLLLIATFCLIAFLIKAVDQKIRFLTESADLYCATDSLSSQRQSHLALDDTAKLTA